VERLGSGGFGVVYLAEDRKTSKLNFVGSSAIAMLGLGKSSLGKFIYRAMILILFIEMRYAVKAIQKSRVRDYETFQNEIRILRTLVSFEGSMHKSCT